MPSERATDLADRGPALVIVALFLFAIPWIILSLLIGEFLPQWIRVLFGMFVLVGFGLALAYQGLFMLVYPKTAVAEEIRPPVIAKGRAMGLQSLLTPSTTLGAWLIALFNLVSAVWSVGLGVFVVVTYS